MSFVRFVRVKRFCELVGEYTADAVDGKIRNGVWIEGREFRRAPDGHILIDLIGFEQWVESAADSARGVRASNSTSGGKASGTARR